MHLLLFQQVCYCTFVIAILGFANNNKFVIAILACIFLQSLKSVILDFLIIFKSNKKCKTSLFRQKVITLKKVMFVVFVFKILIIAISIYPLDSQEMTKFLYLNQTSSNHPGLLSQMLTYSCPIKNFYLTFS